MELGALFPGQGSQCIGMGKEFYQSHEQAKELFDLADKLLGFSLSRLCFEGPIEELTLTKNVQPAILCVSTICHQLSKLSVSAAAGHSLGEYSALVAAGALSFEDAVQLVHKRGCYMQEAVPSGQGKMLAVMGMGEDEILAAIKKVDDGSVEIANLNCPGQTVVAGDVIGVDNFAKAVNGKAKLIPLNVSAPFHCVLMQPAAESLAKDLDNTDFNDPAFPVYANFNAEAVTSGDTARQMLKKQVCGTVRWTDCIQNMLQSHNITTMLEFGPGGVLSKLLKRIDKSVSAFQIFDPGSLQKSLAALQ